MLLRDAIDPEDAVLRDYATHVAPQLSTLLAHVTAKGGNFAQQKRDEGLSAEEVARYSHDQSMRAHLINGLLPAAQIARTLKRWGEPRFEDEFDDTTYRLFCAGFTLHDWLKLPGVDAALQALGLQHHTVNVAVHLADVEQIFRRWCQDLGLDAFLAPLGGADPYLHDLILIASNTQLKWGTMYNLSALPRLRARRRTTLLATNLATLADYLAYLGRTPVDAATHPSICRCLEEFTDRVTLTYHHLSDVRGVITNIINNAAMDAYAVKDMREPLLYAPTGIVYLAKRDAPPPPRVEDVAQQVVLRVRSLCQKQLAQNLTGFVRDGKGLKYADYYELFFSPRQLAAVIAIAAEKRILKTPAAGKRYANIVAKQLSPVEIDRNLPDLLEVDRLAEGCAALAKLAATYASSFDAEGWLLEQLGVADQRDVVHAISANRTTGGVPYGWYYAAGVCRQRTQGLDEQEWVARLHSLAAGFSAHLPETSTDDASGWIELKQYVGDHLHFQGITPHSLTIQMQAELTRYKSARKGGRGSTNICSLCSSSYSISEQQETAILFAPMVYTNKQPLHSGKAIRHICAMCGMEMMLRQLLMKRGRESGNNFEKRRLRYLFFYPTYFFTPETLRMVRSMQARLKRVSFTALRKVLLPEATAEHIAANLHLSTFQHLQELMLHPKAFEKAEEDRLFRLRYEEREPITFSFVGIPPFERDAKDAESWVNPAFLTLVLPLLLDIKVVASEGMLPLFNEATELPETVAFDSAHAFVRYLIRHPRLNLDQLGPALQRLTAAYLVHLDGNAKAGAGGYNYHWQDIPALARNLATSPLYAFHYLKKGQRREGGEGITGYRATLYVDLVEQYLGKGDVSMSHARELTRMYRQFYRHKRGRLNANSILRPISEAADALLDADLRLFDGDDGLLEVVQGRLEKFIENVSKNKADGSIPGWIEPATRQAALEQFCTSFVLTIYRDVFGRNRAALAGRQLNLLKNACESIYMAEQRREWRERNEQAEEPHDTDERTAVVTDNE